jgi:hypothetical protein
LHPRAFTFTFPADDPIFWAAILLIETVCLLLLLWASLALERRRQWLKQQQQVWRQGLALASGRARSSRRLMLHASRWRLPLPPGGLGMGLRAAWQVLTQLARQRK